MPLRFLPILLLFLFFSQCATPVQEPQVIEQAPTTALPSGPAIQFLYLRARTLDGRDTVELVKSEILAGKLKREIDISLRETAGRESYRCSVLDREGRVVVSQIMEHPLRQSVEYSDETTDELSRREVIHQEREFLIRLPYDPGNAEIRFERLSAGGGMAPVIVARLRID